MATNGGIMNTSPSIQIQKDIKQTSYQLACHTIHATLFPHARPPAEETPIKSGRSPITLFFAKLASCLCFAANAYAQQEVFQSPTQKQTSLRSAEFVLIEEAPLPEILSSGPIARTRFIADDASINDVCGIGQQAWAVGERGIVPRTDDGGLTWMTAMLPFECRLSSVCFLTNQIGFIAGSRFDAFERQHRGILLSTKNGGQTWQTMPSDNLPPIKQAQYFDLDNAIAICRPDSPNASSQILRTKDGGKTWIELNADIGLTRWASGDFLSPSDGILAGGGSSYGAVAADQVVTLAEPQNTLRRIHGASLSRDGLGWLAGDGGFLLQSDNGGISWKQAQTKLSPKFNEVFDFHSVDQRGLNICVVGSPGSVILNSGNHGRTWNVHRTESPVPLNQVRFISDTCVLAVGAFGVIHRSEDSGRSWTTVRNANYRAAVLCLTANPNDVSLRMLASVSGDKGYRSVVVQPSSRLPQLQSDDTLAAEQLNAATSQAGSSFYDFDWMFARTQPMQEKVRTEIITAWTQQTDGQVGQLLPQRLARLIRIWKPDVICVESSDAADQLAPLLLQALEPGLKLASDDSNDGPAEFLTSCGLAPVKVTRVVSRIPDGAKSPLTFHGDELLTTLGTTADMVADFCKRQLSAVTAENNAMNPAGDCYAVYDSQRAMATPGQLMAGTHHAPGSDCRRQLTPATAESRDKLTRLVQHDRVQRSALTGHLHQAGTPLNLIANLQSMGDNLPAPMALKQLQHLTTLYASVENLEGEIAVLKEISQRFPDSPQNADATEKLFQYYSSAELRLLRRRASPSDSGNGNQTNSGQIRGLISGTSSGIQQAGANIPGVVLSSPLVNAGTGTSFPNSSGRDRLAIDANWDRNADISLKALGRIAPKRSRSPEILLRHAANLLRQETYGKNRTVLAQAAAGEGLYSLLAQAEMQSMHGTAETTVPILNLPQTQSRPFLDGNLTEPCWEDAIEVHLQAPSNQPGTPDCLIMFAWDKDHFYIAGRIERPANREDRMDQTAPRHHDAEHGTHDRVEFMLDTDRDYTTGFHFVIDEAGQTSERCWTSGNWNPEWFVATESDTDVWRFEAAIPQKELLDQPLRAGGLWAVRARRTIPGILQQVLKDEDRPTDLTGADGFGLLRFIRNRN